MSESSDVAITTVMSILITTSIVGNVLVCAVIKRNREMRIPVNYLLVNLAVAEIMYSTFQIPVISLKYTSIHPEGVAGKVLCTVLTDGNLSWVGAACSIFTLVAIAIERYYAIIYPHGNKRRLTKSKLKVIIPVFWTFSFIISVPVFLAQEYDANRKSCISANREKWITKSYFFTWFALAFISFVLMVGLYSRVVYTLWFKRNDDGELTYRQQGVLKVRKRVTLMVVTVSAIFGICWGTDEALHVIEQATTYKFSHVVWTVTHTMIIFNSAVNAIAYALINQQFREKIKGMLCCCSRSAARVCVVREPQGIELANNNTQQPTNTAGPSAAQ